MPRSRFWLGATLAPVCIALIAVVLTVARQESSDGPKDIYDLLPYCPRLPAPTPVPALDPAAPPVGLVAATDIFVGRVDSTDSYLYIEADTRISVSVLGTLRGGATGEVVVLQPVHGWPIDCPMEGALVTGNVLLGFGQTAIFATTREPSGSYRLLESPWTLVLVDGDWQFAPQVMTLREALKTLDASDGRIASSPPAG